MNLFDIVIIVAVALVTALCVRSIVHSKDAGCASCSETGCVARYTGGRCKVADDMVRRADAALGEKGAPRTQ